MKKEKEQLFWLLTGIFISMSVLKINVGGLEIAIYNISLVLAISLNLLKKRKIHLYKEKILLLLFFCMLTISTFYSYFVVDTDWFYTSLRSAIKLSVIPIIVLITTDNTQLAKNKDSFINGIIISAPIELGWQFFQYIYWIITSNSINKILFNARTSYNGGIILLSGLSWERADTVTVFLISTLFTKKKWIKMISAIGIVLTTSRTGIFALVIIYLYELLIDMRKCSIKKKIKRNTLIYSCALICIIFIVYNIQEELFSLFISKFTYLLERISYLFTNSDEYSNNTTDGHILYYQWLLPSLVRMPMLQVFIGCGTRISGWVYSKYYNWFSNLSAWSVECDFVSLVLGNGIVGAILYYYNLFRFYIKTKSNEVKQMVVCFFFAGFMYQFCTSFTILILLALMSSEFYGMTARTQV